ncbi:substrate-binding domain-containing protein [Cohnella terricola]|nr:substrate-binding domain-containing protein [Cohnella terricola]
MTEKVHRLGLLSMFVFLLIVLLGAWFAGRDKSDSEGGTRFLIGISQPNLSDPWHVALNEEVKEEVDKHNDIRVIFTDAAQSSAQQKEDIRHLVGYGVDLLVVSLDDPAALTATVAEVYRKIPVIVLGRGVTGYDYTLYIGTDNEVVGQKAGEFAAETLKGRKGTIVEVQGFGDSPTVQERSLGFREAIAGSNLEVTHVVNSDWQRDRAEDQLTDLLAKDGNVDLIFAHSESMALGAYRALKNTGRMNIDIIGIDGVTTKTGGSPYVSERQLIGMVRSPTGGREAIQYALDILNKEKGIPKKVILRSRLVTSDTESGDGADGKAAPPDRNGKETLKLGFAQVGSESGWRIAHTNSVIGAAKDAGIELLFRNADQSQERQFESIREFIRQRVDVIAFSPKTETGWEEVLSEAKDAGIPVILSDREVKVKDDSLWTAYIGSDFREEGRRAARWLTEQADREPDRVYRIVELQGTPDSAPALGRKKGFEELIRDDDRFAYAASLEGDFTKRSGKELMAEALEKFGKSIDVVYAHNDDMALGAIEAIEAYGLKPGKDILLISVDATKSAMDALSIGKLNLVVECNPLLGPQLMKAVKDVSQGKDLPMKIITSEGVFTQELVKQVKRNREY